MFRKAATLLAAFALWAALPAPSQAQGIFGCACINNQTTQSINFRYKWGNQPYETRTLFAGNVYSFCWRYTDPSRSSPPLHFQLDRDMGPGEAWTDYNVPRVQTNTNICAQIPAAGQYDVSFMPGTNNQMIHVTKRTPMAAPPPQPAPVQPVPMQPGPGQSIFGCACLNNSVGAPVQFQYRWGNQPLETRTLLPGNVYSFCWRYTDASHTSPPLHFQLNRAVGTTPPAFADYNIPRVQSPTNQCSAVPRAGQYFVSFQPGTNNQFLHVTK